MNVVDAERKVIEDDEVQFVFAAPRRRKRKRKRFEFSYSPSMLNQCSVPPVDPLPKLGSMSLLDPLRRRSLGVLQQLESCHIGTRESKDYVVRRNSLPIAPSTAAPIPKAQASWFANPSNEPIQAVQPPSHSTPMPWWNESRPLAQTKNANWPDWRPLQVDESVSKKRRLEGDLATGQTHRLRQPSQISPRTTPVSTLPSIESSVREPAVNPSEMLWTPDMQSLSGNQPSDPSMFNSWPDLNWNAFDKLDTMQYGPQGMHQMKPVSYRVPSNQRPTNPLHQPNAGQFESRNIWQQNNPQVPGPQVPHPPIFKTPQTPQPYQVSQAQNQHSVLQRCAMPMSAPIHPSQPPAALPRDFNGISRGPTNLSSPQINLQSQKKQTGTSTSSAQTSSPSLQARPSDILRKPSLYKIPAWPSTPEVRPAQIPMTISQIRSRPQILNADTSEGFRPGTYFDLPRPPSHSNQLKEHPGRNFEIRPNSRVWNASGSAGGVAASSTDRFELPRARTGYKHSPNLVVDIAETCQDLFPFAEVADRHSVPIKKVFDTFSAIIQLPLLGNADDRRRHGSLGKQRMREYRDARKAMEKAQEAERKAQLKAMRSRVEEAGKKGSGQANGSGLLKTAIINNASQTGSSS
ncbi:hypothetical protein NA56DRAFT_655219 [Hyaloscypha hepaticicola]|uniref:Uncharacterized protein n=1 Tax=Hyaloscypha hepaticicola TaxID=2082293 RepID=A0A2J6QHQ9_9HELO|nr:hypothetical protein NA56DRAFT_655219 [Hyaloscypha hepaticicola]